MEAEEDNTSPVGLLTARSQVGPAGLWDWQEDPSSSGAVAGSRLQEYSWITQSTMVGPSRVPTYGLSLTPGIKAPGPGHPAPGALSLGARTLQVVRLALNPQPEPGKPQAPRPTADRATRSCPRGFPKAACMHGGHAQSAIAILFSRKASFEM